MRVPIDRLIEGGSGSVQSSVVTEWNNPSTYVNPPTDPRMNSILKKYKSGLKHGILQQHDSILDFAANPQKYPYALRFLWNPSNITYALGTGGQGDYLQQYQLKPDQASASRIGTGSGAIGFKLLFDRTYEVAYGPNRGQPDLRNVGVYADIAFLERVMGAVAPSLDSRGAQIFQPAQIIPVNFLFGGGSGLGGVVGLKYVGWINNATVTYTQFSENMIPQRCEVDLSVTQIVGQTDVTDSGGGLLDRPGFVGTAFGNPRPRRTTSVKKKPITTKRPTQR